MKSINFEEVICDHACFDKAECEALHKQKEAFFQRLIKESKNRLRWLNKQMEWKK